jgi:hypothetical protein
MVCSASTRRLSAFLAAPILCWASKTDAGQNVGLAWDSDPAPNIAGYRLYCGTSSGVYTQQIEVGTPPQRRFSNLTDGTTYFFRGDCLRHRRRQAAHIKRSLVRGAHFFTNSNPTPNSNADSDTNTNTNANATTPSPTPLPLPLLLPLHHS